MRKVFDWTCSSIFRTFGRIIAYIIIALVLTWLFSNDYIKIPNILFLNVNAATLTPRSTFTNDTNHYLGEGEITALGNNNTYSYSNSQPNVNGRFIFQNASTGSAVSGKAYALSMGFSYNLTAQKYYDIVINFRDRDLRSVVNTSSITLMGGTAIANMTDDNISLIGLTNTATTSSNTNKLTIRIYALSAMSYFAIQLSNYDTNITSVNNFGISSLTITEVDMTNSDAIINNNTNNTQNIINNNNDNTQQIIDNQNSLLGTQCLNEFDFPFHQDNPFSLTATRDDYSMLTNYTIHLLANVEYNFSYKSNYPFGATTDNSSVEFFLFKDGVATGNIHPREKSGTFTPTLTGDYYLRLDCNKNGDTCLFWDFLISSKTSNYCEYGSYVSKFNDLQSTLTDDTVSNNEIETALDFDIPQTSYGPFQAFLTIPLQWVQNILMPVNNTRSAGVTCTPINLPLPYMDEQYLTLPCMADFWDSLGGLSTLIQILWVCVAAVRVFNGLFLLTVEVFNTNPDSINTLTKIRSWEL